MIAARMVRLPSRSATARILKGTLAVAAGLLVAGTPAAPTAGAVPCPSPEGSAQVQPESAQVQPAEYPHQLPSFFAGDPFIVADRQSRTYYLYSTGFGPTLTARRSPDLVNWTDPFEVFTIPADSWAAADQGMWAPEVHRYQGRYYLLTTLHNPAQVIREPQAPTAPSGVCGDCTHNRQVWRSTVVAVADTPAGPFELLDRTNTVTPRDFMTLDGTLYVEKGRPWMVYAHEWVQIIDGTIERIPLTPDLSAAAGDPLHMFRGSDAAWYDDPGATVPTADRQLPPYVTDGPQFWRTADGALLMLWTTYADFRTNYTQTFAVSESGRLEGPWRQGGVLLDGGRGHGMIFTSFAGETLLILHNNSRVRRAEIYEVAPSRHGVKIVKNRVDLWDPANAAAPPAAGADPAGCG